MGSVLRGRPHFRPRVPPRSSSYGRVGCLADDSRSRWFLTLAILVVVAVATAAAWVTLRPVDEEVVAAPDPSNAAGSTADTAEVTAGEGA